MVRGFTMLGIFGCAIGVATYEIVASLPEAYRSTLPSPEEIADGLRPTGGHRLRLWDGNVGDELGKIVFVLDLLGA
jgi:hypothetical protein